MALELETAEIPIELAGMEAARQALAALGVEAGPATASAATATSAETPATMPEGRAVAENPPPIDLSAVLAALMEINANLDRIATLIESRPVSQTPTY